MSKETIMEWQPDIVIYHHPCADGFGAAWACHTRWPDADYVPANYGDPPPDVTGKRVLIVDFSYKYDVLRQIGAVAASIVILDHHKTAEADLADFTHFEPQTLDGFRAEVSAARWPIFDEQIRIMAFFDMRRSGAALAWEFAWPGRAVPLLISLVEDRDLWLFNLPMSRPFALWLRTQKQSFDAWSRIHNRLTDNHPDTLLAEAGAMQQYHDSLVDQLTQRPQFGVALFDPAVPVVNCPGQLASDVGNELLDRYPFAPYSVTYSDVADGWCLYSLRSDEGRADVSEIAKRHGGGGHRNAAGFRLRR